MKKLMLTVVAVGLGLLLVAPSFAFGPREGKSQKAGYGNSDAASRSYCSQAGLSRLDLTDEQKTKIEAMHLAYQKDTRPIREKMSDKSVELRRLWAQANPDKKNIEAKQKEVRVLRDQLEDKRTAFRLDVNKVLTPEQREKIAAYGWGRKSGFGPRGGMRGPDRGFGPGMCY
ncbi:MAG: Spy/CpxP family protein refolding chaperone [Syntrophaceae bacterium]|nr:Spy/CpxP family protein refolding chaperone [Syntrophaceae bacterium]